jgi:hypothetical protein
MEGPRAARPEERTALLDLVNRVFRARSGKPPTMGEEFPLLFAPENLPFCRVMVENGRCISHVGVFYQTIFVGACVLPVACIGAVATDPDYREQGLGTRCLLSAFDEMQRDGRVLAIISGGRSLYTRQGCVHVGRRLAFGPTAAELAPLAEPALTVRLRRDNDLPTMRRLYNAEPVRYERTAETLPLLLGAVEQHGGTTVMVERGGQVAAYLVIRHGGPMAWDGAGVGTVLEYAGERTAVLGALHAAAMRCGVSKLMLRPPADDVALVEALAGAGLSAKEESHSGTFRVMDASRLISALRPWWIERLGTEAADSMALVERHEQVLGLSVGGQEVPAQGLDALTHLLFSPTAKGGPLRPALPVPLPDAGLNYV